MGRAGTPTTSARDRAIQRAWISCALALLVLLLPLLPFVPSMVFPDRPFSFDRGGWTVSAGIEDDEGLPDAISRTYARIVDPDNRLVPTLQWDCWTFRLLGWSVSLIRQVGVAKG